MLTNIKENSKEMLIIQNLTQKKIHSRN